MQFKNEEDLKKFRLVGNNIYLRPHALDDVDRLLEAAQESVDHISPWMPWCHSKYTRIESEGWIRHAMESCLSGTEYSFVIADKVTHRFLGACGLNKIDKDYLIANLGYWIRKSEVGHGYSSEAAKLMATFALNDLKLNRVEIVAGLDNAQSQAVAVKIGAKKEGILRNRILINLKSCDAVMYSLIPSDLS